MPSVTSSGTLLTPSHAPGKCCAVWAACSPKAVLLAEFIERYYHTERPHQGLDGHTPVPHAKPPEFTGPTKLFATPVLGGLHHTYRRVAA